MENLPKCPKCSSEYTYQEGNMFVCPECAHEWMGDAVTQESKEERVVKDAHGNLLVDGDSVTIIRDIKIKGSSTALKIGVKVKNIHIVDGPDGHNIEAKVPGFGPMMLKSEIVKKST
jgi:protein PhnA